MALSQLSKEKIRPLVELNDRVNVLIKEERSINSTRIVVVGDQSHGKSSLLEALSGVELPKGEGIKTRVPLLMQMRNSSEREYAIISSEGEEPEEIALNAVSAKVDEWTARVAGAQEDVLDRAIELKVFRHDQDDLTVVDLPGITRVSRKDQQTSGKELEKLILDMCRKYCEPEESVILNVVSSMVDFSTSGSLQLSQEIDPSGRRTLLCVTKIDQYQGDGLVKKLSDEAGQMCLRADRVFAVRNRKQEELSSKSLGEARKMEADYISSRADLREGAKKHGFGLGVHALSEALVSIQLERIQATLPSTYRAISDRLAELHKRSSEIGKPLGDEIACRLMALELIDQSKETLAAERTGRLVSGGSRKWKSSDGEDDPTGQLVELNIRIDDLKKCRTKKKPGDKLCSKALELPGGLKLLMSCEPCHKAVDGADGAPHPFGAFVTPIQFPEAATFVELAIQIEMTDADDNLIAARDFSYSFSAKQTGRGWSDFLSAEEAGKLKDVELTASVYVKSVTWKASEGGESGEPTGSKLLCSTLTDIDDKFKSNVNRAHRDRSFFSATFSAKLAAEAEARRGAAGLPGAIVPEVPIGILRDLRKALPAIVDDHIAAFSSAMHDKIDAVMGACVDAKAHPRFHKLLRQSAFALVEERAKQARRECARVLRWEEADLVTANHYYMDIVQDLRREILADTDAESVWTKRPYLQGYDFASLKAKSNEEQELVDLQIKTFAYWKTTKKRLIDYVQSTHAAPRTLPRTLHSRHAL